MITGTETAHLLPRQVAIIPEARLPVVEAKLAADLNLHDGQIVQATLQVQRMAIQLNAWDLRLPLTAAQFEVMARAQPPSGEALKLRVQVLPNGTIVLRPMPVAPLAETATPPEAVAMQANRALQLSLRPQDLRAWSDILKPGVLDTVLQTALPPDSDARQKLLSALRARPSVANLSGDKIKDWFKNSGIDAEHDLLDGKTVSPTSFKFALRALLEELGSDGADHAHAVHQALDDMEASQMLASQSMLGKEWSLSWLLPFRDAHPVVIRFSRGHQADPESQPPLTIQLQTQLGTAGEVWLQTRIQDLSRIDMMMWTTDEDLAQQARTHSGALQAELGSLGLTMTSLQVIDGRRPDETVSPANQAPAERGQLLDLRT